MSHIEPVTMRIKSIEALKETCKKLGYEFMENQKEYRWYGRFVGDSPMPEGYTAEELGKCEHAIKVPGASYEIGVVKSKTNSKEFNLHFDYWYQGKLKKEDVNKIKQRYPIDVVRINSAKRKGFIRQNEEVKDGKIRLHVYVK